MTYLCRTYGRIFPVQTQQDRFFSASLPTPTSFDCVFAIAINMIIGKLCTIICVLFFIKVTHINLTLNGE